METQQYIVGVYEDEEILVSAARAFKDKGIKIQEVFTPYPIHEILHIQEGKSRLITMAYIYGWIGAILILAFLYYTAVIDWPLNYGGKPVNSFPSFIFVSLIFIILFITIMSLTTFIARAKIFPGKKAEVIDPRATDDKFVFVFDRKNVDQQEVEKLLKETGAVEVYNK